MTILYTTVVAGQTITASWGNNVRDGLISGFATAAARTSAVTSPIEGMVSYRTDGPKVLELYNGSTWQAVSHGTAASVTAEDSVNAPTTTSTSYVDTANVLSASFTAPPSGIVEVTVVAELFSSTTDFVWAAVRLSGAGTYAAADMDAVNNFGTSAHRGSVNTRISGLTAGGSYTATMSHKASSGTATFRRRRLIIQPLMA